MNTSGCFEICATNFVLEATGLLSNDDDDDVFGVLLPT